MSEEERHTGVDISEIVHESEIKEELNDEWWLMHIKQEEQDVESATSDYAVQNLTPWVAF